MGSAIHLIARLVGVFGPLSQPLQPDPQTTPGALAGPVVRDSAAHIFEDRLPEKERPQRRP